jgi:hypothetical protein
MNWTALLQLPATILLIAAALLLLFALGQGFACRRRLRQRRRLAAIWRVLMLLICAALALVFAGGGLALRGYRVLGSEAPVIAIDARILSPQRWALTLTWPDGSTRSVSLAGDDFRVEAVVLKWKLPAVLAGVPPLYRLDRLSGRYDDPAQEMRAPRTVIDFAKAGRFDLLDLKRRYPQYLPAVDTVYGSGAFLPLVNGGHYQVSLMRTGALVARPDAATAKRVGQPGAVTSWQ